MNLTFKKIIQESEASDQAHKMGLTWAGWGKWKDKSGKVTHKNVGDKLVPVGSDGDELSAPKSEPIPAKTEPAAEPEKEPSISQKLKKGPTSSVFTEKKLKDFYELSNKMVTMKNDLEKMTVEYGDVTREMLDEFEKLNTKTAETESFIAKMARKQTLRTNVSYQQGFNFLIEKVNEELKSAAEAALKATEKISYISGKVDVTRKEKMAEVGAYRSLDEKEEQVKQISDEATKQIKKSNENIESLMMLIKILLGKVQ